jgi:hypothetical protein
LSSCCATLSSSCCPLTAPPSCCLISSAGFCIPFLCNALSSSSHSAALIILRWLVVASPLIAPSSRCAALLPSPHPLTVPPSRCLISPASCCVASCHTALLLSSHSTALSLSCAGCLLRRLSSRRPLVLLLSSTLNLSSLGSWTHLTQYSYGIVRQTVEKVERRRDKGGGGSEENKKITNKINMIYLYSNLYPAPLSVLPLLGMLAMLICSVCVM